MLQAYAKLAAILATLTRWGIRREQHENARRLVELTGKGEQAK